LPLKRVDKFGDFEHGFSSNLDRTFVNQPQFDGTMDSGELGYNAHGDFDRDDFHTNSDFGRDDLVVSNGNDVNMFGDSVSWKPGQPR
jgi:hypothetical protein